MSVPTISGGILGQIFKKSKDTDPQLPSNINDITVNDIARFQLEDNPEMVALLEEEQRLEAAPDAPLAMSTYFPGATNNIVKGGYSGSEVGSISAYAPSTLFPVGILDARDAALKGAASRKAKAIDDFQKLYGKSPETKRVAVQGELDKTYYSGLQQWIGNAKATYGSNWATALQADTKFQTWNQDMRTVARYEDGIVDFLADLDKKEADPLFVTSGQTKLMKSQFLAGVGGLSNPAGTPGKTSLAEQILFLRAETDLDQAVNTATKEYADKAYGSAQYQGAQGPYDVWMQWEKTGMKEEEVNAIADGIWKNSYNSGEGGSMFTLDDIKKRIKAIYPERTKRELKTASNQYSAGAGGADFQYTEDDISKEAGVMNVNVAQVGGAPLPSKTTTYAGVTFKKPVVTSVPQGSLMYDPNTGSPIQTIGGEKITFGQTAVTRVIKSDDKKSMVLVTDDQYDRMDPLTQKKVSYDVVAIGTYETPGGGLTGQPSTRTVIMPAASVENAFVKKRKADGSVELGVPIDKQRAEADKLNASPAAKPMTQQEKDALINKYMPK
jgi:hypothetical protein